MNRLIKLPFVARAATIVVATMFTTILPAKAMPVAMSTGQVMIHYGDLDLATARGQVKLQARIDNAIDDMCGAPVFGSADEAELLKACRIEARANAEPKLRAILASAAPQVATR